MKNKKLKILEIIILITIIISLIVIILFALNTLFIEPKQSTSNEIIDYSQTRIHKYSSNITLASIYKIPYPELINTEKSIYNKYITSTDNLITTFTEKITIIYDVLQPEQETIIKNFCNTYDSIELEYKFQCTYGTNMLSISNIYKVDRINSETIKNNHNIILNIPIKKDTLLNEYLETLNKNNIIVNEVNTIE